jgi:hypothetical protein
MIDNQVADLTTIGANPDHSAAAWGNRRDRIIYRMAVVLLRLAAWSVTCTR